jgi:hypothetical protein
MPLQKLSAADLAGGPGRSRVSEEYVHFMRGLRPGEGGRASVKDEGVTRQSVKNRLKAAAEVAGVNVRFVRSGNDEVVFQVVEAGAAAPKRRGRPPKQS